MLQSPSYDPLRKRCPRNHPPKPNAASLEALVSLADEISALVRAGVPLETGLARLTTDLPGRLGTMSGELAQATARGDDLASALRGMADVGTRDFSRAGRGGNP